MLKSRHGCLDQGVDPLKEMGLPGFWAKFEWWCHLSCCYLVWILSQCKWSFISWVAKAKLKSTRMTCCFAYANHPGCCEVTCWSDWKWNISLLILLKSSLYELLNVIGMSWQFVENWRKWILVSTKICYYCCCWRLIPSMNWIRESRIISRVDWSSQMDLWTLLLDQMIFVSFSDSESYTGFDIC